MADSKHFGQSGIGNSVEFGKSGGRIKNNAGVLEVRNNADSAYAIMRGADPIADSDLVTKKFLETQVNVFVTGQINGGAAPGVVDGAVYIVTTAGGAYALGELWRGESGAWVQITVPEGLTISVTDALTGGTDTYEADHRYLWDEDSSTWGDIGPVAAATKVVKSQRAGLVFDSAATVAIGSALPVSSRAQKVIVDVTQAFDATGPATAQVGDAGDTDRLAAVAEIDLTTVGTYICDCYHNYGAETQANITFSAGTGGTAGTATVEIVYSLV